MTESTAPPDDGHRVHRLLPPRRIADPDRARDRLRVLDRLAVHERRGAGGLEAEHPGSQAGLFEPAPIRGDVAGVPDRDAQRVELAELLDEFEGGGLLAGDPELVDGVDERNRMAVGELADELQRLVEVPAQRDDAGAVHERLGELAGGDLALWDDHRAADPGAGRIRRGRGGCVPSRRADDGLGALADGGRHRTGHPAILE